VKDVIPDMDFILCIGLGGWYYMNKVDHCVPTAVHFHGYDFLQEHLVFILRLQSMILRYPFMTQHKNADIIFSLGGRISEMLIKHGVPAYKIVSIPNAIEKRWIRNSLIRNWEPRRFVFVGRYSRTKGIELLEQAIKMLFLKYSLEVHFIGPIPASARLEHPSVIYHGTIEQEDKLQAILQSSDILVCPSYSEGMPTVILEAMAAGCAIIATDVGAVQELVNEEIGWLIPAGNVRALYEAMELAIQSSDSFLSGKKQSSVAKVWQYTWPEVIDKTIGELENRM